MNSESHHPPRKTIRKLSQKQPHAARRPEQELAGAYPTTEQIEEFWNAYKNGGENAIANLLREKQAQKNNLATLRKGVKADTETA